ncbi:MAG: hypothetical protein K2P94_13525 [Rhodospirillaceae bacterium]|nr:hypothetical protein [Rhodospirillaceae bacterium]
MKNTEWPLCRTARLPGLAVQGQARQKSGRLKSTTDKPASRRSLKRKTFPRFEDVTREEARMIAKGAPRSGRFQRHHGFSLTGNAAALCELEAK